MPSQYESEKVVNLFLTKWAQVAVNGPVWVPQALKPLCLIQFWGLRNSIFSILALWGNKNWPPSMKVTRLKISTTKEVQRDANGPVWMPQALETLCLIHFLGWKNSLFPLLALWGNKNWPPSMKVKKLKIFWDRMSSKGCKWSSLNAPGTENPLSHQVLELGEFPFSIISPLG